MERGGGKELANDAGVPFIGAMPIDPTVRVGGDVGQPVVISNPKSAAAKALQAIALDLAARISVSAVRNAEVAIPIKMIG